MAPRQTRTNGRANGAAGYMAAILPKGMRAVSTEISAETGAGASELAQLLQEVRDLRELRPLRVALLVRRPQCCDEGGRIANKDQVVAGLDPWDVVDEAWLSMAQSNFESKGPFLPHALTVARNKE